MASATNNPPPRSDTTDLEVLFANGIDLQTADGTTIQKYVVYMFQLYADRNIEDYRLWDAIQIDFGDFKENHFNKLDGPTWNVLRDYCYMHGYWIDHNYGPGKTQITTMLKTIEADWYDTWTLDQIKWVENCYDTLSRHTLKRKQELIVIGTNSSPQQCETEQQRRLDELHEMERVERQKLLDEQILELQRYEMEQQRICQKQEQARQEQEQRECDNERREQQHLERIKRFEEQETARQQYEMKQQRIRKEQELERQKAEQKAKDEVFACRRYPAKFSLNTKLHVHISTHYAKPAKAASAITVFPLSTILTPPTSPSTTRFSSFAFVASVTPLASTPAATPKPSYAARAGCRALLTPPITPNIAKPICAKPKPAYMTMEDLFRKFAGKTLSRPLQTITPLELRPQSLQTPPLHQIRRHKVAATRFTTAFHAPFNRSNKTCAWPSTTYTQLAVTCQKFSSFAVSTWEWTRQLGLQLRALV